MRSSWNLALAMAQIGTALAVNASDDYKSMSAADKQKYIWMNIQSDTHSGSFMNPVQTIVEVMQPDNLWAMTKTHEDWRRSSHRKCTHGIGAHAKAHFSWKPNKYSGMFQKADNCVIRMANAAVPGGIAMTTYGPNLAVKCFRDGAESANLQFIWTVDGYAVMPPGKTKSCSYFEAPLCNHNGDRDDIAIPLKDTFIAAFQKIDPHSMFLGVSQMATGSQDGKDVSVPHLPFALVLKPAKGLNMVRCDFNDPISQLLNLEAVGLGVPGKTLYEVYAVADPSPKTAGDLEYLGDLVFDSAFTRSIYGDHQLFFRHTFFKDELELMKKIDPSRADNWLQYANDAENYKKEGANLYWPLLPKDVNGNHSHGMLETDASMIV